MTLSLGTAQLGLHYGIANYHGMPTEAEAQKILDCAWACGIRHLDTAPLYGCAEERINRWHARWDDRAFRVTTKVTSRVQSKLTGDIDAMLWHYTPDTSRDAPPVCDGLSIYGEDDIAEMEDGLHYWVYQLPASALDGRAEPFIGELHALGRTVQVRSLFVQGHALHLPYLAAIARDHRLTIPEICIRWAHELPADIAIFGAETPEQVIENVAAFERGPLPRSCVAAIDYVRRDIPEWAISPRMWNQKYAFG